MRPDVVTFWHGPLDALRRTCLRSQVAAGHKVTVYSFGPLPGLPDGVGNAEAEAILPHSFSERLRPPQPDGSWRDWTILQFSDFFRMRLMTENRNAVDQPNSSRPLAPSIAPISRHLASSTTSPVASRLTCTVWVSPSRLWRSPRIS